MARYEVSVTQIDFEFSTHLKAIASDEQSELVSQVLGRTWILGVDAEENLTGPLCQQISNETGCLVRDVKFTATKLD